VLGVWPGPYTLRELVAQADFRLRADWNRTAAAMALLANCHRKPGAAEFQPRDFHPMETDTEHRPRGMVMTPENLHIFAKLIVGTDPEKKAED